jgi:thiol-disulfide isomerase/thioredoxin
MRWIVSLGFTAIFLGLNFGQSQNPIQLKKITYAKLMDEIKSEKGKIILVDFWGEFCLPCKKEFPNFVTLHRKYGAKGLICLSVSLDDPEDEETTARVVTFLKQQQADCRNVLLSEKPKLWQEKLKMVGPPGVFLFGKDGKLINRWSDKEVDYSIIEKRILALLKNEK